MKLFLVFAASIFTIWSINLIVYPLLSPAMASLPGYNGEIAFTSQRDGNTEIYTMMANGQKQTRVTNTLTGSTEPRWSPDGSKIVYHEQIDGSPQIVVIGADGSNPIQLTNTAGGNSYPDWSPDGERIAFSSVRDGDWEIYTMNTDGSNLARITNSLDRDWIPSWSPDGSKIAFVSSRDGNYEIFVMNADGSGAVNITNNPGLDHFPKWSPDGTRIGFTSERDGDAEVYSVNIEGGDLIQHTNNSDLDQLRDWSPDGKRFVFMSDRDGDFEVYTMNIDGSSVEQLTFNDVYDHHPAWLAIPNKAPVVKEDSIQMVLNKSNIIDVLKNDSDEEALDAQYLSISSQPAHGSTKIVNGKIEYTPKKGFVGNDVLVYQICDSFLMDQKCAAGVMDILVKDIPSPPTISSVGSVALNGANKVFYTSNKPTFSGTAEPFATVKIEIHSDPIVLTTTADADGNWSVTPDQDIPNGEHTVKITTIKDGVESEPITFVLGINVGLAETGVPLWPIGILGFMGFILSSMYVRKNLN